MESVSFQQVKGSGSSLTVKKFYSVLRGRRPEAKEDLKNYVKVFCGLKIPDRQICGEHQSPLEYLWHVFSFDFKDNVGVNADVVVWANRGGGKTELAAVATLLDCVFKPGWQVPESRQGGCMSI